MTDRGKASKQDSESSLFQDSVTDESENDLPIPPDQQKTVDPSLPNDAPDVDRATYDATGPIPERPSGPVAAGQSSIAEDTAGDRGTLLPGQWHAGADSRPAASPDVGTGSEQGSGQIDWGSDRPDSASEHFDTDQESAADAATIDIPIEFTGSIDDSLAAADGGPVLPKYVGKFRVMRELGRGAFGVVYLARDELLNRRVAIKLSLVDDASYQDRLLVEASNVTKVEDDHIVPVYQVDRTDFGAVYVVQKYIDGCTLGQLIKSEQEVTPGQAIILLNTLAVGLRTPHEQGMLHRDLKPDNILLDVEGKPWIVDFGLAIFEQDQIGASRQLAGTPPYMSPEQIKGRVDFMDARSDIWALGVIFYELLTGKLPFNGRTRDDLTQQICNRDPKPLQQRDSKRLTEEMDQFFRRCCAKQPQDRFAHVDEMSSALVDLARLYATEYDHANPLGWNAERATKSPLSLRTSTRPTGNESLGPLTQTRAESLQTIQESVGGYLRHIFSVAVIAAVVAAVFLFRDRGDSGTSPGLAGERRTNDEQQNAGIAAASADTTEESILAETSTAETSTAETSTAGPEASIATVDPDLVAFDSAGDSARRVAKTGPANHRTIGEAIAAAAANEIIEVEGGFYDESLTLLRPVRLKAANPQNKPRLRGDGKPLLTIDCDGQAVTAEGFIIAAADLYRDADGAESPADFNAIDVLRGTLGLKDCDISKEDYGNDDQSNCVKVHSDAKLIVTKCRFTKSPRFTISTTFHDDLRVIDCDFASRGIQIRGGAAAIENSRFAGEIGIQVQESRDSLVTIRGCSFQKAEECGINVTAGGKIDCRGNVYETCKRGIWVGVEEDADFWSDTSSRSVVTDDGFNNCGVGVEIGGGIVSMKGDCSIQGGQMGILVTYGDLDVSGLVIKGCSGVGIYATKQAGELSIVGTEISDCGDVGIWAQQCKTITVDDTSIRNCNGSGLTLQAGKASIESLSTLGVDAGIQVIGTATITKLRSFEATDCNFGILAKPDEDHESIFAVEQSTFVDCVEKAILAFGNTKIRVSETTVTGSGTGTGFYADDTASIEID